MKKRFFATVLIAVVILIGLLRIARREESQFVGAADPKGAVPTPQATETDAAEEPQAAAPLPEPENTQLLDQETSIPPSASIPFIHSSAEHRTRRSTVPFRFSGSPNSQRRFLSIAHVETVIRRMRTLLKLERCLQEREFAVLWRYEHE